MTQHVSRAGAVALAGVALLFALSGAQAAPPNPRKPLPFTGVNLAGAEFGRRKPGVPPVHGQDYAYPHENEVNYFASKGMNVFRIPFHWEAMQHKPRTPIVAEEMARLRGIVEAITRKGYVAIIDPHNYGRYDGKIIGGPEVSEQDFAFFWEQLATPFKNNPRVWFGLMNEPHDMPDGQWLGAANAAIAAIRKTGAKNLILVPGNHWTGAHSWAKSSNGTVMLGIKDPADRYIYEVHQYLNSNSSGAEPTVVSPTIGSERLKTFVEWCRKHKKRAFLGEFGTAANPEAKAAVEDMLTAMEKDSDVWVGFTWWAAGPRWGNYMFSIEPKDLMDRPQMSYLQPHLQPVGAPPAARPVDPLIKTK